MRKEVLVMASDEITLSGISFNHGTNGEYEFYSPTNHTGSFAPRLSPKSLLVKEAP
jgi:hypothetical protein